MAKKTNPTKDYQLCPTSSIINVASPTQPPPDVTNYRQDVSSPIAINTAQNAIVVSSADNKTGLLPSDYLQSNFLNPWKRKNSISLPAGLDTVMTAEPPEYEPQLTPENVRNGCNYDTSDTFSEAGGTSDDDNSYHIGMTSKIAGNTHKNVRRKSAYPLVHHRALNDIYRDAEMEQSPQTSVTSINSIASLLKEKLMMSLPSSFRKKKPETDWKLRLFVFFLFIVIAAVVGFSHIYYYKLVLQREYFPYTKFNKEQKYMKLYSNDGIEIALGHLGVDLPETDKVYRCLSTEDKSERYQQHEDDDDTTTSSGAATSLCFEWMEHARIQLNYERRYGQLNCYNIKWYSLSDKIEPTDCYEDGYQYGHWYGGGRTLGMAWPVELGRVEMSPFVTGHIGRHRWGNVLKRYFINSKGVAITVDPQSPLYVSINAGQENRLCLKGRHDQFTYFTSVGHPTLNYTICMADNIKTLHYALAEKSLWDGLKQTDTETVKALLAEPVWQIVSRGKHHLTEAALVNYTEDVIALGFLKQGHVLLNEHWQTEVGDFTFDKSRFPTINETLDVIHRRGFRIMLTIQPFIGTESVNFAATVQKEYLITERGNEPGRNIPALTRYKTLRSAGMLDITNNNTSDWLQGELRKLFDDNDIDALYLDLGSAYDLPRHYQLKENLTNPDYYKDSFVNTVLSAVPVLGVSSAIKRPPAPAFLSLPSLRSTWESLQVIIPTILTYGIVGYPFLMPGSVGGDYVKENMFNAVVDNESTSIFEYAEGSQYLPDRELYIRWLQLATFLPVIRFSYLPSQYDDEVVQLARNLTALRQQTVNPLLIKYVQEALDTGIPLIRPLWMMDPSDSTCHTVKDEFSIGEEMIVAPILSPKSTEREVYLPAGVWKDGIDGSLRKGSRWLHYYKASLHQIPYFMKKPNNTRL